MAVQKDGFGVAEMEEIMCSEFVTNAICDRGFALPDRTARLRKASKCAAPQSSRRYASSGRPIARMCPRAKATRCSRYRRVCSGPVLSFSGPRYAPPPTISNVTTAT